MRNSKTLLLASFVSVAGFFATDAFAQDPAAGQAAFRKCAVCHAIVEGQNKIGPSLFGVVGRTPGTTDFRYSPAMTAYGTDGNVWDAATLDIYIENPRVVVPGTRMSFPGVKDADERAALIAYLDTLK